MCVACYKCSIMTCIVLLVLQLAEYNVVLTEVSGVLPQYHFVHKLLQNAAILDTSNEFIGLYREVHSGATIRGADCINLCII